METSCTFVVDRLFPPYSQLYLHHDRERAALWCYLNPDRTCATLTLVGELRDVQERARKLCHDSPAATQELQYLVFASANPAVFSFGGDLELFVQLIETRDRDRLYDYGRDCIDVVYQNWASLGVPTLTTISLVQGMALGGGFEGALSSNVLIAEENAQLGFPEVLFNLFPGMGGYSLLTRRIEPWRAERLLRSANQYRARELRDMGVVDVLAPDGEGVHAVNDFIRQRRHTRHGQLAIQRVRQRVNPLTREELLDVIEIWVDTALGISARDLRLMTQLHGAQRRYNGVEEKVGAWMPPAAKPQTGHPWPAAPASVPSAKPQTGHPWPAAPASVPSANVQEVELEKVRPLTVA